MSKIFIRDLVVCPNQSATTAIEKLRQSVKVKPDVLIVSSSHPEPYGYWSRASAFARDAQIDDCFAFDIKHGCNGGNLALKIGKDFLKSENTNQVLIIVDDQLKDHVDRMNPELTPFHAWGNCTSAVLLTKDEGPWEIQEFTAVTDPRFADNVVLKSGESSISLQTNDETEKEIGRIYRDNYMKVIRESLKASSLTLSDCLALCMNQGDWKLRNTIQRQTGVAWIQDTFSEHGHLGGSDIFLGLTQVTEQNLLKSGQAVVLASSALGYSWSGQVLRKC